MARFVIVIPKMVLSFYKNLRKIVIFEMLLPTLNHNYCVFSLLVKFVFTYNLYPEYLKTILDLNYLLFHFMYLH